MLFRTPFYRPKYILYHQKCCSVPPLFNVRTASILPFLLIAVRSASRTFLFTVRSASRTPLFTVRSASRTHFLPPQENPKYTIPDPPNIYYYSPRFCTFSHKDEFQAKQGIKLRHIAYVPHRAPIAEQSRPCRDTHKETLELVGFSAYGSGHRGIYLVFAQKQQFS